MNFGILQQIQRTTFPVLDREKRLEISKTILRNIRRLLAFLVLLISFPSVAMANEVDETFWNSVSECRNASEVELYL